MKAMNDDFLHGWFEMRFYQNFSGFTSLFGNNYGNNNDLQNGLIHQEMGNRIPPLAEPGTPSGVYDSLWRGNGSADPIHRLQLTIMPHPRGADAFILQWIDRNDPTETYSGIGNLVGGDRMLGWYRQFR